MGRMNADLLSYQFMNLPVADVDQVKFAMPILVE
jgi:hypothetical protein